MEEVNKYRVNRWLKKAKPEFKTGIEKNAFVSMAISALEAVYSNISGYDTDVYYIGFLDDIYNNAFKEIYKPLLDENEKLLEKVQELVSTDTKTIKIEI